MIFSTYWFVSALPIFLAFYALPQPTLRTIVLVVFCVIFHAHFAGAAGVLPIIVIGAATYLLGLINNRRAQVIGIVGCCLALIFYKYSHFICQEILGTVYPHGAQQLHATLTRILPVTAPLAISFFVFEFVHYLWDRRKGTAPISNPLEFLQFAIFFPSLVAGPIKRYEQFLPSLKESKKFAKGANFCQGLVQVAAGFFKKIVLADNLTLYINYRAPMFASISMQERWLFLLALSFRIYFDFSGYSDIAIGIARMMGVELPINFNWPYLARNMRDFWHRWHISLSLWLRDYVYIPLGGSKHGRIRTAFNGFIAFALCGLWHGAAWNFVLWGLYHGLGLTVSNNYRSNLGRPGLFIGRFFDKSPVCAWAATFCYVSFGWLLFFYPLAQACEMAKMLFPAILVK
jgi:alginate O-acetyltransferase complex protein AlgI